MMPVSSPIALRAKRASAAGPDNALADAISRWMAEGKANANGIPVLGIDHNWTLLA